MKNIIFVLIILTLAGICRAEVWISYETPPPYSINDTATFTALVRDSLGNPVPNGTVVSLHSAKGIFLYAHIGTDSGRAISEYRTDCTIGLDTVIAWTSEFGSDTVHFEILPGPPDTIVFVDIPDTLSLTADGVDNALVCVEVFDSCGNLVGDDYLIYFDTEPPLAFPEPYYAYTDSGRACTTFRADTITGIGYMVAIYGDTFSTTAVHPIKLGATAINENNYGLPVDFTIDAHPNPFNSAVSIAAPEGAQIEIFDLNGRRIDVIPDPDRESRGAAKNLDSRFHGNDRTVVWQPSDNITSGVYLVRAKIGDESVTKRVVYLK